MRSSLVSSTLLSIIAWMARAYASEFSNDLDFVCVCRVCSYVCLCVCVCTVCVLVCLTLVPVCVNQSSVSECLLSLCSLQIMDLSPSAV